MRHRKRKWKFNRTTSHRKALFRTQVTQLLKHEKIVTTEPKAKMLRRWADRMITLGKTGSVAARREARRVIREREVLTKLFAEIGPRYKDRAGGYTRIIRMVPRPGDNAKQAIIELVK